MTITDDNDKDREEAALKELTARPNGKKTAEQRAKVEVDLWLHEKSREVIRSHGGMITTKEVMAEVLKDSKAPDEIAEHFEKRHAGWGTLLKENPEALKREIDEAIAEAESFDGLKS
jgi:hypothetical protein